MRNFLIFLFAILFSGCAVKSVDENYRHILIDENSTQNLSVKTDWWREYNQPYLDELIELGLKNSINLAKSAVAVNRALAQAGVLEAELIPSFNANFGADASRDISRSAEFSKSYKSGVSLSYEVDLWRKLADARDAAIWEAEATKFDLAAAKLTLINAIADSYFEILYLNESLKFYNMSLRNYNELEAIIRAKFELGKLEELSLRQIQSSILNIKNRILSADRNLNSTKQTLRNLLSVEPDFGLNFSMIGFEDVKFLGVNLNVPIYAVSNRPDLQAAIARIEESLLNVKVSQKNFYPSVTIGASLSGSGDSVDEGFRIKFLGGNLAINLPFLNYSRLKNNLKISEYSFETMKLNYQDTLITALNEIDTGYKNWQKDSQILANYEMQMRNLVAVSETYKVKFDFGKAELKDFLEAKNSEIDMQNSLLLQKYKILQDEISVYKAMAGKFER